MLSQKKWSPADLKFASSLTYPHGEVCSINTIFQNQYFHRERNENKTKILLSFCLMKIKVDRRSAGDFIPTSEFVRSPKELVEFLEGTCRAVL